MKNAPDVEEIGESADQSSDAAIAPAPESPPERKPYKRKRVVTALVAAIDATDQLIVRTEQRLVAERERPPQLISQESIAGWEKALKNLLQRRESLLRLKSTQETHID